MREQVTLYGSDAEQFRAVKEAIAERRGGNEPSNAETVRLLMQVVDHRDVQGGPDGGGLIQ
jgi:hypothetical protein